MDKKHIIGFSFFVIFLMPYDAFAYLDPGTGSVLLQGVLGGIVAIGLVLKLYWHRFLRLLGIRKKTDIEIDENAHK